jgi:hypothetical protein
MQSMGQGNLLQTAMAVRAGQSAPHLEVGLVVTSRVKFWTPPLGPQVAEQEPYTNLETTQSWTKSGTLDMRRRSVLIFWIPQMTALASAVALRQSAYFLLYTSAFDLAVLRTWSRAAWT